MPFLIAVLACARALAGAVLVAEGLRSRRIDEHAMCRGRPPCVARGGAGEVAPSADQEAGGSQSDG